MKKKLVKSNKVFTWIALVILVLYALTLIVPLLWVVMSSAKSRVDFRMHPFGWPENFIFKNYILAFKELYVEIESGASIRTVYFFEMFGYTILYVAGALVVSLTVQCVSAYIAAKYNRYPVSKLIYSIVIVTMVLPIVGSLPSELQMARTLHFYDNMIGIWIMKHSGFGGLTFLIFYAMFKGISWDYAEAAQLDGASYFKIFIKVMLPFAKSTIYALGLLGFIGLWNDYSTPMVFLPSYPTVAYGLYRFQFSTSNVASSITLQFAACTIVMVPVFTLYIIFRNKLFGNVAIGGIKG